jgi:tetratricopeptide (TPR) repeat protein
MKKLLFLLCLGVPSFAQDAKALLDEGLKKAQAGEVEAAVKLFDQSLALKDDYPVRQSRGMARSLLRQYEDAIADFTKAISFNPQARKSYLSRGIARKKLTDYDGAMADFSKALALDARQPEVLYNRALVYELLEQPDKACEDYKKALAMKFSLAELKVETCQNAPPAAPHRRPLARLAPAGANPKYGLTKETPVKVGTGPNGDTENVQTYFELLRDAQGKPVNYRKTGTSALASKNAPGGRGTVEAYEVQHRDAKGTLRKSTLYVTFYEFETPRVPAGFGTVKPVPIP